MISIDFECGGGHRFEGCFRDHGAFTEQFGKGMVRCPVCDSAGVKRIYTGCSIQARSVSRNSEETKHLSLLETICRINSYVRDNFENVGRDFADTARSIHYGREEARNIYGESTSGEIKELVDEGVGVFPLPDVEKLNN